MLKDDDIQQEVDNITQEQNKKNVITTMDVRHIVVNFVALLATSMLCHKFPILKHEINDNMMEKIEVPQSTWKYQDNRHGQIVKLQLIIYFNQNINMFVEDFDSNVFFNIDKFIGLLFDSGKGKTDETTNNEKDDEIMKMHLQDAMITVITNIAEFEFVNILEQKGISTAISKQLFHKLLDKHSYLELDSTEHQQGGHLQENVLVDSKQHFIIEIIDCYIQMTFAVFAFIYCKKRFSDN